MGSLWTTRCSGCEKPWTTLHGGQYCTTPGCPYASNLPVSKTGMSSPSKPIADPAVARDEALLERASGWTPALPFTDFVRCTCWVMAAPPDQQGSLPHASKCPLYEFEEPEGSGLQYEDEDGNLWVCDGKNWNLIAKAESAILLCVCGGSGGSDGKIDLTKHAPQCPAYEAKSGHSCKFCGRPIHAVGAVVTDINTAWVHDDANDFMKCGLQATPKAKKLTGVCVHGNALVNGCQACDGPLPQIVNPGAICVHGFPISSDCPACDA